MDKNEFEDLGMDIWIRLLKKNEQYTSTNIEIDRISTNGKSPD